MPPWCSPWSSSSRTRLELEAASQRHRKGLRRSQPLGCVCRAALAPASPQRLGAALCHPGQHQTRAAVRGKGADVRGVAVEVRTPLPPSRCAHGGGVAGGRRRRSCRGAPTGDPGAPPRGEASVGESSEPFAMDIQAVSKHLKLLEDAGLVTRGRRTSSARRASHHVPCTRRLAGWSAAGSSGRRATRAWTTMPKAPGARVLPLKRRRICPGRAARPGDHPMSHP